MLNLIKDNYGARKKSKRLGRGIGSGKGKTCARGGKGQTARSGVALAGFEGGQMPLYRRLPKRGFNSLHEKFSTINFSDIQILIKKKLIDPERVTIDQLRKVGLIKGKLSSKIKLLGAGKLDHKFNIEVDAVSKSAENALINAGGKVVLLAQGKKTEHKSINN